MATAMVELSTQKPKGSNSFAYGALVLFSFLYFARPEDFIPGMGLLPIEKILGGVALIGLFSGIQSQASFSKWPRQLKYVLYMVVWQAMGVPFASFIGGAFSVVSQKCIKCLICGLLVGLIVNSVSQIRRLIFIQASSVAVMTFASVLLYKGGRMGGVLGGVFDNPNDLAINIALNFPLCLMFLMVSKSPISKLLWFAGLLLMGRGLMLTYSRSGFLAMVVAIIFSLYEFGIRNKHRYLLWVAGLCVVALAIIGPQSYGDRIKSIVSSDVRVYGESKEDRFALVVKSLEATLRRPVFGVGAGQFPSYSGSWQPTHNTYTELSSECGIPVLLFFLLAIRECFKSLSQIRKTAVYQSDEDVRMLTSALWAALTGYLAGAAFASTSYQLFPYFMIGYTTALLRVCQTESVAATASSEIKPIFARHLPGWMAGTALK